MNVKKQPISHDRLEIGDLVDVYFTYIYYSPRGNNDREYCRAHIRVIFLGLQKTKSGNPAHSKYYFYASADRTYDAFWSFEYYIKSLTRLKQGDDC